MPVSRYSVLLEGATVPGQEWWLSFFIALYQGDVGGIIQRTAFCELFAGGAELCAVEYPFATYGALTDHDSGSSGGGNGLWP
jgi:hypothetical protein